MLFFLLSEKVKMGAVQAKEQQQVPIDGQPVSLDGIQAKVVAVNVEGLNRTQNDVVMDNVKELFNVRFFFQTNDDRFFKKLV